MHSSSSHLAHAKRTRTVSLAAVPRAAEGYIDSRKQGFLLQRFPEDGNKPTFVFAQRGVGMRSDQNGWNF
jgi:hypothetical protein